MSTETEQRYTSISDEDKKIGQRLRTARLENGYSMYDVAKHFGITGQQIQKFEAGLNRVSAKMLYRLSRILGKPVNWFLQDLDKDLLVPALQSRRSCRSFHRSALKSFYDIQDEKIQRKVLELLKTMSNAQ